MANAFNPSANQWEIDTVDADPASFHGDQSVYVKSVRWVGGTTAGHTVVLKDAGGKVLRSFVATGANYSDESLVEDWWRRGFAVPTLASGKVYVDLG